MKDTDRLVAAYDDAAGVTAEFNRNVLRVLNRELSADFDPDAFAHVARFDPEAEWIEMRLRSIRAQTVAIGDLDLDGRRSPTARRCAPRSAPSSGASGRRARAGRRGLRARRLVDRSRRRLRTLALLRRADASYPRAMPYHPMTDDEVRAFLDGRTGTTRHRRHHPRRTGARTSPRSGTCVDDDGTIVFTTGATTVKGRTLRRTGWAAMTVDDDRPPFSFVTVEGPVTISDDLGRGARTGPGRIGGRYMGADRADEYGERNGVPGELLIRLTPHKVVSAADLAD